MRTVEKERIARKCEEIAQTIDSWEIEHVFGEYDESSIYVDNDMDDDEIADVVDSIDTQLDFLESDIATEIDNLKEKLNGIIELRRKAENIQNMCDRYSY